ncbi:MAG: glucose-6-phosphate dehydrogenase assembly protein OpcA [Bryobacteraceae bacterium]
MAAASISPSRILRELDQLWVDLGSGQDADRPSAVLRACAMTLVVATEGGGDEGDELGETLAQLVRAHPSRLIVLRLSEGQAELDARVIAQCWMPFGRRQQICCERIEITGAESALRGIPPVLQGLTVPDLPVVLWCRSRAMCSIEGFESVLVQADKLIVDSTGTTSPGEQARWIASLRTPERTVADLAWTRLTRWRESVAQVFDEPESIARLSRITGARLTFEGPCAPMASVYLAAWLEDALNRRLAVQTERAGPAPRPGVRGIELFGDSTCCSVKIGADRNVEVRGAHREARALFPRLGDEELLREELAVMGRDEVYESALARAPEVAERMGLQ